MIVLYLAYVDVCVSLVLCATCPVRVCSCLSVAVVLYAVSCASQGLVELTSGTVLLLLFRHSATALCHLHSVFLTVVLQLSRVRLMCQMSLTPAS